MQVDLLCSGSKGNACLIQSGSTKILIDCGGTKRHLQSALLNCDTQPNQLDAVLITHSHSDHIRQLALFSHVPIYACCSLPIPKVKNQPIILDFHPVNCPQTLQIGDLKVLTIPTSHDSGPSMGFVISHQKEKLVYITDTGYLPADVFPLLQGADYYIFESNHDLEMLNQTNRPFWLKARIASDTGHLCNQDAARLLSHFVTSRTKHIILAHLSEEANCPKLALQTLEDRFRACGIDLSTIHIEAAFQWTPIRIGSLSPFSSQEVSIPLRAKGSNVTSIL